jgi:protein-S-isoprenylcysteine O-methyltransferase Ste14
MSQLFRVARPASDATNLVKTLVQVVVVWGFALVLLPAATIWTEGRLGIPRWPGPATRWGGAALLVVGSGCGLWSAWVMTVRGKGTPVPFDAARELVIAGPYRIVRNPMAVSAINQTIGIGALLGSFGVLALAAGGGVVWHTVIRPPEERFLVRTFGAPYQRYRRQVRCWIPTWPPYDPGHDAQRSAP